MIVPRPVQALSKCRRRWWLNATALVGVNRLLEIAP